VVGRVLSLVLVRRLTTVTRCIETIWKGFLVVSCEQDNGDVTTYTGTGMGGRDRGQVERRRLKGLVDRNERLIGKFLESVNLAIVV